MVPPPHKRAAERAPWEVKAGLQAPDTTHTLGPAAIPPHHEKTNAKNTSFAHETQVERPSSCNAGIPFQQTHGSHIRLGLVASGLCCSRRNKGLLKLRVCELAPERAASRGAKVFARTAHVPGWPFLRVPSLFPPSLPTPGLRKLALTGGKRVQAGSVENVWCATKFIRPQRPLSCCRKIVFLALQNQQGGRLLPVALSRILLTSPLLDVFFFGPVERILLHVLLRHCRPAVGPVSRPTAVLCFHTFAVVCKQFVLCKSSDSADMSIENTE